MRPEIVDLLRCPASGSGLALVEPEFVDGQVRSGWLENENRQWRYAIRDFIPRFVPEQNYAANFGIQWNRFRQTQLDSYSGTRISADRFWKATGWRPQELRDTWVLDAGCGAGRFAEVALEAGANVVAVDYSSAVDACHANLASHARLHVLQGDIYRLPLKPGRFTYIYSLGVLQHTPHVRAAFDALPPMLSPAGGSRLCVDFYERSWKSRLLPRYALRPFTTRMDKLRLFRILERCVPALLSLSNQVSRIPKLGPTLRRAVPVANYAGILPLSERQLAEWALLDTFDWLAPAYDDPQTASSVEAWLREAGLTDIHVTKAGHLVGRGSAPNE